MKEEKFGAFPTHPGEVLKDEIECRGISQRKLAAEIGMSHTALNEILNAKRSVTPTSAFLFEASLIHNLPKKMKKPITFTAMFLTAIAAVAQENDPYVF